MHLALHFMNSELENMDLKFHQELLNYLILIWYLQKCKFVLNSTVWKWIINWNKASKHTSQNRLTHIFSTQNKNQTLHLPTFLTSFLMYITRYDLGHKVGKSSRLFWHQNGLSIFFAGNGILPIFSRSRYILK